MERINYNKNVAKSSEINASLFSDDEKKWGQVVICNDIDEPGLYVFTKNSLGEQKIQKVNDVENIVLDDNYDTGATGAIAAGDSLYEMVSKLQNQINDISGGGESEAEKVSHIIVGVGLNPDGTYKAIAGNHVADATSIADAISKLDAAIDAASTGTSEEIATASAATLNEAEAYTDQELEAALDELNVDLVAGDGEVFVELTQVDGKISGDVKTLSVVPDASGLQYDLKLGDFIFGTINIPQDQFLKSVVFIPEATQADAEEAASYGILIEIGKPYLKFMWQLTEDVVSPTYVNLSGLINVYDATGIKMSDNYSGTSFDIKSGTTLEDAVGKITNELTEIENSIETNSIVSDGKTISVAPSTASSATSIDVHIDNDTIVKSDLVSKQGELSVALSVEKEDIDSGYVRTKYTLKSTDGVYGVIKDTRDVVAGDTNGFISVTTAQVSDQEGNRTDKTTIEPVIQEVVNNANGPGVENGNGLVTAWGVKSYIRDGMDGDGIMVGDDALQPHSKYYGAINFDGQSLTYDTVHEGFYKVDNNTNRLAESIGLEFGHQESGITPNEILAYPSAMTQDCLLIKDDRTIMDALVTLDTAIDDMDYTADTEENKVFTGITQTNGHVEVTSENLTSRKLAGYEVGPDNSGKVAATDTLGEALGKLQGQVNGMDYTANTSTDKVFTYIQEVDGVISVSADTVGNRIISDYVVGADAKVDNTDSVKGAFGKLQGQIDAMDYEENTSTDKVFTYIKEVDGKVSVSADTVGNRILSDYVEGSDAKLANTDSVKGAFGKLQGQINAMDYTANTSTDKVFTYVQEVDGKVSVSADTVGNRIISDYVVGSDTKLANTDSVKGAFGKLQGQIDALDYEENAGTDKVFTYVKEVDGKVSVSGDLITNRIITGYETGSTGKVAATDSLGVALSKLQGQVDGLDYEENAGTDKVFTYVVQEDGLISVSADTVGNRILSDYVVGSDAKLANTDSVKGAFGKLQGQINALDYTANTSTDKVFTYVGQEDGKLTLSAATVGSRILSDYVVGSDAKVANTDDVKGAFGKLQGQINALDYTANTSTDKVFTYVAQEDGKLTLSADTVGNRILSDYAEGSDAKLANTDSVKGAFGKLQGQINAMNKAASSATGQFVRTVTEVSGKVSETKDYIKDTDVKITAATAAEISSLGTNVKEAYKLVNNQSTQLGDWIKIYKDSSIVEIYLGTSADTINASTGAIDKKTGDKESLNYAYYTVNGTYSMTKIDLEDFLTEPEFKSGVTVTNHIAHGVVDTTNSEKVVTGYTAAGADNGTAAVLSVDGSGFKVSNIQTAINAKVTNAISLLDSNSATTNNSYAITGITMADGKITGIGQTNKIASASTAGYADNAGTVANKTVGNASGNVPLSNGTKNVDLNADTVDGYHIVVGSTGTTANTIYIL